jgi:hypothetical protein
MVRSLATERLTDHLLGCHRSRISERAVFEKLVQVLAFGCAYERIADASCSESTLRREARRMDGARGDGATQGDLPQGI